MNNTLTNRMQWLDVAKGITIILMVLGHTSIPKFVSDFIWAFHMPLFFIASGWCTNWKREGVCKFITKKVNSLLLPFVVYSVIVLSINLLTGGASLKTFLCKGWQGYALWFIPVLFFASVCSKLIMAIKQKNIQIILWVLMVTIGAILSYAKISFPWTISTVPYACFFIILGSKLRKYQEYIISPHWWLLVGGFVVTFIVSHFCRLDMASNKITPVIITSIGACAGTAMIFTFSSYITKYTKYSSQILQGIGRETYLVLALSQIIIILLNQYFTFNSVTKYAMLVIILFVLKYVKDTINVLIGKKIL